MNSVRKLTPRERECLLTYRKLQHVGRTATELGIAEQTVKNHLLAARRKLGVRKTATAIMTMERGSTEYDDLLRELDGWLHDQRHRYAILRQEPPDTSTSKLQQMHEAYKLLLTEIFR